MEKNEQEDWKPNEKLLEQLMNMGISKMAAEQALFYTGNNDVGAAVCFVFDSPEQGDVGPPQLHRAHGGGGGGVANAEGSDEESDGDERRDRDDPGYKMVFVVNTALEMGTGKIAAQVAHASLGLYRTLLEYDEMIEPLDHWTKTGQKKIVVKGENHIHLQELQKKADQNQVPSYLVHDAGRTQIPANSITVLGLFGSETLVNSVSGNLKLL